jgi:hypothetical protein
MMAWRKNEVSNPRKWRAKSRTATPNARQKRNGLFLDDRPTCERCKVNPSEHAHHDLPRKHPRRYDHQFMRALCEACHVAVHQAVIITVISQGK